MFSFLIVRSAAGLDRAARPTHGSPSDSAEPYSSRPHCLSCVALARNSLRGGARWREWRRGVRGVVVMVVVEVKGMEEARQR